jgi:hypothetical protein
MGLANAVLQLLVHSPPPWNLFRELGNLKGQRGAGGPETGGATPLVDATVKFFEEFMFKEGPSTTQQPLQLATRGKQREEEEKKENKVVDSFEPTYMYAAMNEKRQLKNLLVCSRSQGALFCCGFVLTYCIKDGKHEDAEEFFGLYLDALDEELVDTHISGHKPASTSGIQELLKEVQSTENQTPVGRRDHTVRQLSFLSSLSLTFLTHTWTRIGKFSRVAHLAHIRWKIPFDRTRDKPARYCQYRRLAITQTLHPGLCLPFLPRIP